MNIYHTFQVFYFIIIKEIDKFYVLHLICFTNFHIQDKEKIYAV